LRACVTIRKTKLFLVADAAVEIGLASSLAPEGKPSLGENVADKFGDGAVEFAHQGAKIFTNLQITQGVVVIVHQRGDEGDEAVLVCVVGPAVPEELFGALGLKRGEFVAASGGKEVDGVVAVPVLLKVFTVEEFMLGSGGSAHRNIVDDEAWSLK
jgi:hypothetical protein